MDGEEWNRRTGVELRVGADGDRHELRIQTQKEQLFPVATPVGQSAARRRDLPRPRSRRERAHIHLGAPGLVGVVGNPAAVGREAAAALGEGFHRERRRAIARAGVEDPELGVPAAADRDRVEGDKAPIPGPVFGCSRFASLSEELFLSAFERLDPQDRTNSLGLAVGGENDPAAVRRPDRIVLVRLRPGDELRSGAAGEVVDPDVRCVMDGVEHVHGELPAIGRKARGSERLGLPDGSDFPSAPIEPEQPRRGCKRRRRDENAVIGDREEREALPVTLADLLGGRGRVSLSLQTRQVEPMREERALAGVQQAARGVTGIGERPHDHLVETAVERPDPDRVGGIVGRPGEVCRHVEEMPAIRQKLRISVRRLVARRVEFRHGNGLPAAGRHAKEGRGRDRAEDDRPVAIPRAADAPVRITDRQDRAAGGIHALQLPVGEESDEAAVGRPEGEGGVFRADDRLRGRPVEVANPEGGLTAGLRRCEGEARPVGRDGQLSQEHFLRKLERGANAG